MSAGFFAACGQTPLEQQSDLTAAIHDSVQIIEATDLDIAREELVILLLATIRDGDLSQVDNSAIDDIARLLNDDNDPIRGQAAAALGYFGPRAAHTIPALRDALAHFEKDLADERELLRQSGEVPEFPGWLANLETQSPGEICRALMLIGDTAPPELCQNGIYGTR